LVVAVGVTLTDPLAGKLPNGGMFTAVALVVVQLRTAVAPLTMLLGCALNVTAGFSPEVITLTSAEDSVFPPGPLAVAV
jgi:hypothetical protein